MPTATWRKWATIMGIAGVVCTLVGSLGGATLAVARDRFGIESRLQQSEQRAAQHEKTAADHLTTIDGRLNQNDAKWERVEGRLDTIAQDAAVTRAIVERLEKRVASPAANPFHRQLQQDEKDRPLAKGQHVGQ